MKKTDRGKIIMLNEIEFLKHQVLDWRNLISISS